MAYVPKAEALWHIYQRMKLYGICIQRLKLYGICIEKAAKLSIEKGCEVAMSIGSGIGSGIGGGIGVV